MAITIALVFQGHNRLRYLMTAAGVDTGTITSTGAASPDLLTDSLNGPIKNMAKAFTLGYGLFAAGALTQAQSRAIWMADNTGANVGNANIQRARPRLLKRTTIATNWLVDANVDGPGHPTITVSADGAGTAYLDLLVDGAIGA